MPLYFYDSHGSMWVTCHRSDPEAEAFGPRWTAKRHEGMSWSVAIALGLVTRGDDDQFDVFELDKLESLMRKTLAEKDIKEEEANRLVALGMMDYPS